MMLLCREDFVDGRSRAFGARGVFQRVAFIPS